MGLQYPNVVHAGGRVAGTNGAKTSGAGFTSARSATGTYDLTLEIPADATECWITGSIQGATQGQLHFVDTSDSVKQVLTFGASGTVATDLDFNVTIMRAPSQ